MSPPTERADTLVETHFSMCAIIWSARALLEQPGVDARIVSKLPLGCPRSPEIGLAGLISRVSLIVVLVAPNTLASESTIYYCLGTYGRVYSSIGQVSSKRKQVENSLVE